MAKTKRVSVGLTESEHAALERIAEHQRIGVSTVLARIARAQLSTGQISLPDETPIAPISSASAGGARAEPGEGPAWLPPLKAEQHQQWVRDRAAAVQSMIDRYPIELAALGEGWARDPAVREQLWALSVWRDLLDVGAYEDPRMELAFASALADFARYLSERLRATTRQRR